MLVGIDIFRRDIFLLIEKIGFYPSSRSVMIYLSDLDSFFGKKYIQSGYDIMIQEIGFGIFMKHELFYSIALYV